MTLQENLEELADAIAVKCKALNTLINGNEADLAGLTTTEKSSLLASINEVRAELNAVASSIGGLGGGVAGQVLVKTTDTDFDFDWQTLAVSNSTVVWTAPSASDIWLISHNLGRYPSVTVVDSAGSKFEGSVQYLDINTLRVSFKYATGGKAYLV